MDKYKIVGIINVLLGVVLILMPISSSVIVNSSTSTLQEAGLISGSNSNLPVTGLIVLFGIINIFLGFKLFSGSKTTKNKYFTWGIILAVLSLFVSSFYTSTVVSNIMRPVNDLYSK